MAPTDRNHTTVHASHKALLAETENPEPFVYTTSASQRVVFPDPGELDFEDAEQWMLDIQKMNRSRDVFLKWVGEEAYEKIRADKLTLRQINVLMTKVQQHYHDIFGDLGESPASRP